MAPLSLVVKGNKAFTPFSLMESEDDLYQSWKICAKIKSSLEHGSRLENLSWRLWFREQNKKKSTFQALSTKTVRKLKTNTVSMAKKKRPEPVVFEQPPFIPDYSYLPAHFTSDRSTIDPLFQVFPMAEDMEDGWDFGYPSPSLPYYSPTATQSLMIDNALTHPVDNNALYVANTSLPPPPPTATLHSKLLGQHTPIPFDQQGFTTPFLSPHYSSAPTSPRENKKPSSSHAENKPVCTNCGATSTPLWRRSIEDDLLCNACGLYQKLHKAPRPRSLKPHNTKKEVKEDEGPRLICSNCSTKKTPLWRRDDEGAPLCNACGLYLKLHHERRPLSMKTDIIKKRQRYESNHAHQARKNSKRLQESDINLQSDSFMLLNDTFSNTLVDDMLSNCC
ncbi:hypothetical protein BY458DRAFT_438487 [Sporodiniella umbellata]|nr:hypothetical protein BY458DRAFT_438487 [Sporodiniella umbellata]